MCACTHTHTNTQREGEGERGQERERKREATEELLFSVDFSASQPCMALDLEHKQNTNKFSVSLGVGCESPRNCLKVTGKG